MDVGIEAWGGGFFQALGVPKDRWAHIAMDRIVVTLNILARPHDQLLSLFLSLSVSHVQVERLFVAWSCTCLNAMSVFFVFAPLSAFQLSRFFAESRDIPPSFSTHSRATRPCHSAPPATLVRAGCPVRRREAVDGGHVLEAHGAAPAAVPCRAVRRSKQRDRMINGR